MTAAGLAVAIIGNDGSRGKAALAGILLIAAGLAIRLFVKTQIELRAAAVGIGVVGIVAVGVAIAGNNLDKAGGWLVIALLFLAAWALPGFLAGRSCSASVCSR